MNIYQQQILDNFHNPYHSNIPSSFTHSFELKNLSCGDEIKVYLNVIDNLIEEIHYQAVGCAISVAAASLLAQSLEGKTLTEVRDMTTEDIYSILGIELTPNRQKCAILALEAIQEATLT